jgi:hypothetical protein
VEELGEAVPPDVFLRVLLCAGDGGGRPASLASSLASPASDPASSTAGHARRIQGLNPHLQCRLVDEGFWRPQVLAFLAQRAAVRSAAPPLPAPVPVPQAVRALRAQLGVLEAALDGKCARAALAALGALAGSALSPQLLAELVRQTRAPGAVGAAAGKTIKRCAKIASAEGWGEREEGGQGGGEGGAGGEAAAERLVQLVRDAAAKLLQQWRRVGALASAGHGTSVYCTLCASAAAHVEVVLAGASSWKEMHALAHALAAERLAKAKERTAAAYAQATRHKKKHGIKLGTVRGAAAGSSPGGGGGGSPGGGRERGRERERERERERAPKSGAMGSLKKGLAKRLKNFTNGSSQESWDHLR